MKPLVLIVDDEPGILTQLSHILEDEGFRTIVTGKGEEALELYRRRRPAVVFLDIWLPDRDGLETLQALRAIDPEAVVVMISGHGTAPTAVRAIKLGAYDYLEKPLAYSRVLEALNGALAATGARGAGSPLLEPAKGPEQTRRFLQPPAMPLVRESDRPQRTVRSSTVVYGLGLHSGSRTGMAIQPLPVNSGVHFVTLPKGTQIPAHLDSVADTEYATTLSREGESIRTVEHLLAALHAFGITNLLLKVHGEIPVLDGSALEFCERLEEIGIEDQGAPRRELVIDRRYETGSGDRSLVAEPADEFSVSYRLRYPPPVGEQYYEFTMSGSEAFKGEIAPARTFGFMRDLPMMAELGLGSGGRLDNCILVGDDGVVNTELRFPDEFVRHKILDIVGDLYLLGYPVRGRITARFTGHRDNIALQQAILGQSS
ncbi:MAG TPA: UDP-3-O-acyl-N-acetylglucosamine deacetylase [Thermoanaerobaculaceae bacterium]|nr:UDP-3-O-acyl-N-acetylglucosamine deacetylase [Thermoanaerobaculaceae bacterium]